MAAGSLVGPARRSQVIQEARIHLNWVAAEIGRTRGEIDAATLLPWHCPKGRFRA